MKKQLRALLLRLLGKHICQHKDCLREGVECHLNEYDYPGESFWWYCPQHCQIEGFCYLCGEFWGGCEEFDLNKSGLCPPCKAEVESELASDFENEMADQYNEVFR